MTDKIPDHVTMTPVTSSQISAIGHDAETRQMYVEFPKKTGPSSVYLYENVSVGSHFIQNIKNAPIAFPFSKLDLAQPEAEEE